MLIDSGSKCNVISDKTWQYLKNNNVQASNQIRNPKKTFISYGSKKPLYIMGAFDSNISVTGNNDIKCTFYVIKNGTRDLLGKESAVVLHVLKIGIQVNAVSQPSLKKSFPKFRGVTVQIPIDQSVKPVVQPHRRIPIPLEEKVAKKLEELKDADIIEEVNEPSPWVSPIVPVLKEGQEEMWLTALVVVSIVGLLLYLDTRKPRKFPPGPKWLPILGSALEVKKSREKTGYLYKSIKQLSDMYCMNSPLIGLKIGKDQIVMVNTVEANKEMLHNEHLDGRPTGIFYQTRTWGERRGVLVTDGELWKEQRKFLIKHLKEFGFGRKGMSETAVIEGEHMTQDILDIIGDNKSATIQMHNFFNTYILNTLWTMMAGIRYNPSDPDMVLLQAILFELFAAIDMVGCSFSHFPVLSILAPKLSGYRDFLRTHKRIWKFLRKEISKHKMRFDPNNEDKDFMDVYLRVLREHGEINTYSEAQLVATCMDMFMAGTETTSKSMSFCFSYLVREQGVQKKAQEEIDRVVGRDRIPCLDDRPNMPYNEALVLEGIRHFMGRTFGVPHRALRNTTLAGYNIPKDTMILSNFPNMLMDDDLFPEPYSFKPERFMADNKLCVPEYFFPFGLSKHRCMGDVLAKCNMFVFTTTTLQRFNFLPVPGEPLPSLDHVDGATASAAPFNALVVPRIHNK